MDTLALILCLPLVLASIFGSVHQHDHSSLNQGGQIVGGDIVTLYPTNFSTTSTTPVVVPGSTAVVTVSSNRRIFIAANAHQGPTAGTPPMTGTLVALIRTYPGLAFIDQSLGSTHAHQRLESSSVSWSGATPALLGGAYQIDIMTSTTSGTMLTSGMVFTYMEHPGG